MDSTLESVGAFGLYQKFLLLLIGCISALVSMNIYGSVFIVAEPQLICDYKENNNNQTETNYKNHSTINTCQIWSQYTKNEKSSLYKCSFDTSYYTKTIITDWKLVCDQKYLASLTQTFFMVGTISGMAGGIISDRYGRKLSTLILIFLLSLTLVLTQLILLIDTRILFKYIIFSVSQFLCGIISNCLYCTVYVLLLEVTTDKYHTIMSNINLYFFVFGELVVLLSYYLTRNWYLLAWIISLYSVIFAVLTFFTLPESPRWLVAQKRYDEAIVVLNKIGRINGSKRRIESDFSQYIENLNENNISNEKGRSDTNSNLTTKQIFKTIFFPKANFMNIYLLIYIWIAISLLYFGVSMGITSIDFSDPYLIFLVSSIVEIIGLSLCYLNDKFGRKKALFAYLITASITCSVVAVIPSYANGKWAFFGKMSLALIGKCMVSAAFNTCYMFTVELYDTSVRNTVILFLTCIGGVGSLISPQINLLRSVVWEPLPYIIFGASSFLACFALLLLPETHHK